MNETGGGARDNDEYPLIMVAQRPAILIVTVLLQPPTCPGENEISEH